MLSQAIKTSLATVLVSLSLSVVTATASWAAEIGVVDTEIIGRDYKQAQVLAKEVKSKEDELQKLRNDLAKELKDKGEKASPVEKKALEERLNKQFMEKVQAYRDWTISREEVLRQNVERAIQQVAQQEKLDMVLTKTVVLQGGRDVTPLVVQQLNR